MASSRMIWSLIVLITEAIMTNGLIKNNSTLKILDVVIPRVVDVRQNVKMSCSYETGNDTLSSVKWYKNGLEFFRYTPVYKPHLLTFPLHGAHLDLEKEPPICGWTSCSIVLDQLSLNGSGTYSCEISGEGPFFWTTSQARNVSIMAFPLEDPTIEGFSGNYSVGDMVDASCKSAPSPSPPEMKISFNNKEINGQQVSIVFKKAGNNKMTTSAHLEYSLSKEDYRENEAGVITLKCTTYVSSIPHSSSSISKTALLISNSAKKGIVTPSSMILFWTLPLHTILVYFLWSF